MNQVFIVKLLDGRIVNINCDALELKKNIQSYEQSASSISQTLVTELNITKENIQNMETQIQVLKSQNSNILSIINKQNSRIQLLESNLELKEQEYKKGVSSIQHQINQLQEEHEKQLKIINYNQHASEADFNCQIEERSPHIIHQQEKQEFQQKIKMINEGKQNLQQNSTKQTLKQMSEIEELKIQLELSQQTLKQKGQENSQVITNLNQKMLNQKQEYDKKLEQLDKQMYDRETELINEINGLRQQIQNKISTIDELGQAINTLTTQKTDLENYNSQLKQSIEQQALQYSQLQNQASQQLEQQNQYYQQLEQQIQQYMMEQQEIAAQSLAQEKETLIQKHKKEMEDHKRKFRQLQIDKDEQEEDYNNISRQLQQTKSQLQETLKKLNQATQTIKQLDDEKEELSKGKSDESYAAQIKEREIKRLKGDIISLNKTIQHLQSVGDAQRDQYSSLLNLKQKETSQFNEEKNQLIEQITDLTATIGNYRVEIEFFQKQVFSLTQQYKNSQVIIQKICTNQQDLYINKIIGPMEKIMNSEFNIECYAEDSNLQMENTEYIIHEIGFDKIKALNLMKEQKWMGFDECLLYQTQGSAKTIRSVQPNADVTLLKGYIIQIEEAENGGLKDKKLLRKEYKSSAIPMLSTKEEAGKLSQNNMLCKFLLEKFNSIVGFPKIQGKQIQIQRQFVLQVKGKEEYCYCEMIEEGQFEKINGGAFQVKDTDIHQYLNAFSLFTYHIMNRQLIITNLQVVGQYLHDMIVSTQYKIFTPIDQGSSEIAQTIGILEKAPQAALSKYWNEKIEQQVKLGWK